jgi:hypothetical protein
VLGEVERSVGPDGGAWRGFCARTTRSQRHAQTVCDRPSVVDRNFSPFFQIPNLIFQASKIPQKFVLIEEIMGNPFCLNREEKLW